MKMASQKLKIELNDDLQELLGGKKRKKRIKKFAINTSLAYKTKLPDRNHVMSGAVRF